MTAPRRMWHVALPAATVALLLDQAAKWWILLVVMQPPRVIEVTPFFNLTLAWNRGISFSLLRSDSDAGPYILSAAALAIVAGLAWWVARLTRPSPALGAGLVMGGAIGNVIDRLVQAERAVVDFLDFHLAGHHWPAFNLADSAIVVGVGLILIDGLFATPEKSKN